MQETVVYEKTSMKIAHFIEVGSLPQCCLNFFHCPIRPSSLPIFYSFHYSDSQG